MIHPSISSWVNTQKKSELHGHTKAADSTLSQKSNIPTSIRFPAIISDLDPMAKEPVRVLVTGAAGITLNLYPIRSCNFYFWF